jgi:hypothetical protein
MLTKEELYGGSAHYNFTFTGEIYQMADWVRFRVWYFTSDDIGPGVVVRLPDPQTILQRGGLVFCIANSTTTTLQIQTHTGFPLNTIAINRASLTWLRDPDATFANIWISRSKDGTVETADLTAFTVNFGGDTVENNKCETYSHETDSWTTRSLIPLPSGTPFTASAGDLLSGTTLNTFFGFDNNFYLWAADILTVKATPAALFDFTGFSSTRGLASNDFIHIGDPSTTVEYYQITGDAWSAGVAPILAVPISQSVCTNSGTSTGGQFNYVMAMDPDTALAFLQFEPVGQTWLSQPFPAPPWASFAPFLLGLEGRIHLQQGSFGSGVDPTFSTNAHSVFSETTITWFQLPPSPVFARGMGAADFTIYRDRYTFGMGAAAGYPGTPLVVHYKYSILAQSYTSLSTFAWGTRDRREGSWARTANF